MLFPALGGAAVVVCIAAFVAWRMLWPPDNGLRGLGVGSPAPIVQPEKKPQPVKPNVVTPPKTPEAPARRALETTAASTGLRVTLGDSMDHVKSVYRIVTEPFASGKSLGLRLPLSGIYFFFTEADKTLENIRVDAPFEGSVEGVHIGDPVSGILSRFGEPYTTPWDFGDNKAYAYRIGGRTVRFDVNKSGKVETIFQIK